MHLKWPCGKNQENFLSPKDYLGWDADLVFSSVTFLLKPHSLPSLIYVGGCGRWCTVFISVFCFFHSSLKIITYPCFLKKKKKTSFFMRFTTDFLAETRAEEFSPLQASKAIKPQKAECTGWAERWPLPGRGQFRTQDSKGRKKKQGLSREFDLL